MNGRIARLAIMSALLCGSSVVLVAPPTMAMTSQVAAGTSASNLPTENKYPGAQYPPYICCWSTQGQYVTFAFNASGGSTNLALRYSAGSAAASRKIELDGTVWIAKQTFAKTANWSTWNTLTLNTTLTSGAHTLKIWFDSAAGSAAFMNLDDLTVTTATPPAGGVVVSLGYADSASGLTPWQGSPATTFIGESAQCCATHGPDNGASGFDAGAIEIANRGNSPFILQAVTAEFGGGSSPSSFDLWGGGTAVTLPQNVPVGGQVVLTMTSKFNFDTSDLFGEACHLNSGVVPVVKITINGNLAEYFDDHQILNSDGADLASCPNDISEQVLLTPVSAGHQPAAPPINDVPPSTAGTATESHVLSGFAGGWNASPPPSIALQWLQCNSNGAQCAPISGATTPTYVPTVDDVGSTLRLSVTASNASGSVTLSSPATSVVKAGPQLDQFGHTSTGFTAKFVHSTTELGSIFQAPVAGVTTDFEFFARGAGTAQKFTPKVYSVVNGAKGVLLATGAAVTVPKATNGEWYVATMAGLTLQAGTKYDLALDPSGAYNGTYVGAETNGTMSYFLDFAP